MNKTYNYKTAASKFGIIFWGWGGLVLLILCTPINKYSTFAGQVLPLLTMVLIAIAVSIIIYMTLKRTCIEISDYGIRFEDWGKK